jgi:hypothetical protein
MNKPKTNKPLEMIIKKDQLIISIGIDTLAFAFENSPQNTPYNEELKDYPKTYLITDKTEFARDVISALRDEREDGSTIFTDLLDKACMDAVNDGSIAVEENN